MAKKVIQAQMQQRRDTAANWAASNPVLLEGELGIVTDDPNLYKIGDGVTAWNDLKLRGFDGTLVQTTGDSENAAMSQKAVTSKLTELESKVEVRQSIPFDDGFLIALNEASVGATIAPEKSAFASFCCANIVCSEGEVYILTTKANTQGAKAYCIVDANGVVLEVATWEVANKKIEIPANGARLYANSKIDASASLEKVELVNEVVKTKADSEEVEKVNAKVENIEGEIIEGLNDKIENIRLELLSFDTTEYIVTRANSATAVGNIFVMFENIKRGKTYRITASSDNLNQSFAMSSVNKIDGDLLSSIVEEDFIKFTPEDMKNGVTKIWTAKEDARYAAAYIESLTKVVMKVDEEKGEIIEELSGKIDEIESELDFSFNTTEYIVTRANSATGVNNIFVMFENIKKGKTYHITASSDNLNQSFAISSVNKIDGDLLSSIVEEDFIEFTAEDVANGVTKTWTAKEDARYATAYIETLRTVVMTVGTKESEFIKKLNNEDNALRLLRYRGIMTGFPNSGEFFQVYGSYDLDYWEKCGNRFFPKKGSGFTRDPSLAIIKGTYYIAYTDASGWEQPCHTIGMARTSDFKTYEELDILECGTQFKKVWAPAFYKENEKVYIIYAATTTGGSDFQVYISEYDTINHSLSEPTRLNIGGLVSAIDYHIHKIDGVYYAVGKDDIAMKTVIAKSSTLLGDYEIILHEQLCGAPEEGQFVIRLAENRWRLFLNDFSWNKKILYLDIDNLASPSNRSAIKAVVFEGEGVDAPIYHPSLIDNNHNGISYPTMNVDL